MGAPPCLNFTPNVTVYENKRSPNTNRAQLTGFFVKAPRQAPPSVKPSVMKTCVVSDCTKLRWKFEGLGTSTHCKECLHSKWEREDGYMSS